MAGQRVATVQLCVDDRLDHARIRRQVAEKLRGIYLAADRIILANEVGGNFGANFRNTVEVFQGHDAEIVFCALLHHDDCAAAALGRRQPLEQSAAELAAYVAAQGLGCPVYTGQMVTATNEVVW